MKLVWWKFWIDIKICGRESAEDNYKYSVRADARLITYVWNYNMSCSEILNVNCSIFGLKYVSSLGLRHDQIMFTISFNIVGRHGRPVPMLSRDLRFVIVKCIAISCNVKFSHRRSMFSLILECAGSWATKLQTGRDGTCWSFKFAKRSDLSQGNSTPCRHLA